MNPGTFRFLLISVVVIGFIILVATLGRRGNSDTLENTDTTTVSYDPTNEGIKFPTLLPDGQTLRYFQSGHEQKDPNLFWEETSDGKRQQLLTEPTLGLIRLEWSPDRSQAIAAINNIPDWAEVSPSFHTNELPQDTTVWYRINFTDQTIQRYDPAIRSIRWSPDGSQIVYIWQDQVLAIAKPDGSDWHSLWDLRNSSTTSGPAYFAEPTWAKEGTIMVQAYPDGGREQAMFWQIDSASGIQTLVLKDHDFFLVSPTGEQGVAVRVVANSAQLELFGQTKQTISISGRLDPTSFTWSPDGTRLYYLVTEETKNRLEQLVLQTSQVVTVTNQPPIWPINALVPKPDNKSLLLFSDEQRAEIQFP
ncbi:MAG: hypothetical protein AAB647_01090 [Patescibacteria group bacterium]